MAESDLADVRAPVPVCRPGGPGALALAALETTRLVAVGGIGVLLLGSWAGLVLPWGMLAGQLVALREAITGYTGLGALLARALPVWDEGTLLGPTIAGIVQLFRPQKPVKPAPIQQPTQPAVPEQPAQQLNGVARRLTLPSPAVRPDQPPDASALAS